MEIWYSPSAFKHGIDADQIQHLVDHWPPPFAVASAREPGVDVHLYIGEDARGRRLEVIGRPYRDEAGSGEWGLHVFHADRLRSSYQPFYEEQVRWRSVE